MIQVTFHKGELAGSRQNYADRDAALMAIKDSGAFVKKGYEMVEALVAELPSELPPTKDQAHEPIMALRHFPLCDKCAAENDQPDKSSYCTACAYRLDAICSVASFLAGVGTFEPVKTDLAALDSDPELATQMEAQCKKWVANLKYWQAPKPKDMAAFRKAAKAIASGCGMSGWISTNPPIYGRVIKGR